MTLMTLPDPGGFPVSFYVPWFQRAFAFPLRALTKSGALHASSETLCFLLSSERQDVRAKTGFALPSSESFPPPKRSRLSGAEVGLEAHLVALSKLFINRKRAAGRTTKQKSVPL